MREPPSGTVTLVFTDIEGSTKLLQRTGDAYADLLDQHRRLLRKSFQAHGGYEVDIEGDAFFVAFASANDAVAAAAEAQHALAGHEWPEDSEIRVRVGVHTGEPRLIEHRYVGLDVHQAARVMAAGHGGQVLISQATRDLLDERHNLRDLGEHRLKDLSRPQRLYQLQIEGLAQEFPALKTLENRPTNLPIQPTALIGRARELEEVATLLRREDVHLVTLNGTGGTGKTRLALQVAAELFEEFADGVFFVSLAPIHDPELVIPTIAQTLGVREQAGELLLDTVNEYVRDKQQLLLLDNFEQVSEAAAELAVLLQSAKHLKLLATSRRPLHLSGEHEYPVPPLALPDPDHLAEVAALAKYEAVALFIERAQAVQPNFGLTHQNVAAVVEICTRLDGLPLAIELAAARTRILPVQALLERLDQRLKLLTGGAVDLDERQQTMRATIDWSYQLLSEAERILFARLAVFVGGCRLDAAEAVSDPERTLDLDVLEGVSSLVEKNLLRQRQDAVGEPRFWLLETIREFGLERLQTNGASEEMHRRHAAYFLDLAERVSSAAGGVDQQRWFDRLDADNANVRAAIEWTRKSDRRELTLRFATALWPFWAARGHFTEGREILEEEVAVAGERSARALLGLCKLRASTGSGAADLLPLAQEALEKCERLGDTFSLAQAWNQLGQIQGSLLGQHGVAEQSWKKALTYAEQGDHRAEAAEIMGWLMINSVFGPLPVEQGIALCEEFFEKAGGDATVLAFCRTEGAVLEAMRGDFSVARKMLAEGNQVFRELGLNVWAANNAQEAFFVEMLAGNPEGAATVLRSSYQALQQMGETGFMSTIAGFLAHALYAQRKYDESDRFSRASEAAAAPDDVISQVLWRTARAKVCARRGDFATAESLGREAVEHVEQTDLLNAQADALVDLAEILTLAGQSQRAYPLITEAARKYEKKGNLAALARKMEGVEIVAFLTQEVRAGD